MGVHPELQTRRPGALVVIKKIGALGPKAEDIPVFTEDRFGFPAQGLAK
jgi:hypothetical protein